MKLNSWDVPNDGFAEQVEDGGVFEWNGIEWQILLFPCTDTKNQKTMGWRRLSAPLESPLWRVCVPQRSWRNLQPFFFLVEDQPFVLPESNYFREYLCGNTFSDLAQHAANNFPLAQRFYVDSELQLRSWGRDAAECLTLNGNHQGEWNPMNKYVSFEPHEAYFSFGWNSAPDDNLEDGHLQWWKSFQQEIGAECDFRFAQQFDSWNREQRAAVAVLWGRGDYLEAQKVLEWAFLSQSELWDEHPHWRWKPDLFANKTDLATPLEPNTKNRWMRQKQSRRLPFLQDVVERVNAHFSPRPNEKRIASSYRLQRAGVSSSLPFVVRFDSPTQHQRLEAALNWREWLEKQGG